MLTLFSLPKPFRGNIDLIQHNAIISWMLLEPKPEIILIGDEEGTAEVSKKFGLRYIPQIEKNEFGTPLVNSILEIGQSNATNPLVCYINADIILTGDIIDAVIKLRSHFENEKYLLIGGKWDIDYFDPLEFKSPLWKDRLHRYLKANCRQASAFEYFIFPKDLKWDMPAFAVGRTCHDNWFIYKARKMGIPVIDGTKMITAVHQRHNYAHYLKRNQVPLESPEARNNLRLLGFWNNYTLVDAIYFLTFEGLIECRDIKRWLKRIKERSKMVFIYTNYLLKVRFYPYSYPLYIFYRGIIYFLKIIFKVGNAFKQIMIEQC